MENVKDVIVQTAYDPERYDEQNIFLLCKEKDCWHEKFICLQKRWKEKIEEDYEIAEEWDYTLEQVRDLEELNENLKAKLKKAVKNAEKANQLEKEKLKLENKIRSIEAETSNFENETYQQKSKICRLEEQNTKLLHENEILKNEIETLNLTIEEITRVSDGIKENLEISKTELENWKSKYIESAKSSGTNNIPENYKNDELLEKELEQTKEYLRKKVSEFESLRKSKTELYNQMIKYSEENQKSQEKLVELDDYVAKLNRYSCEIKSKDNTITELKHKLDEKESLVWEQEIKAKSLSNDLDVLSKKIKTLENVLHEKEKEIDNFIEGKSSMEMEIYSINLKLSSNLKRYDLAKGKSSEVEIELKTQLISLQEEIEILKNKSEETHEKTISNQTLNDQFTQVEFNYSCFPTQTEISSLIESETQTKTILTLDFDNQTEPILVAPKLNKFIQTIEFPLEIFTTSIQTEMRNQDIFDCESSIQKILKKNENLDSIEQMLLIELKLLSNHKIDITNSFGYRTILRIIKVNREMRHQINDLITSTYEFPKKNSDLFMYSNIEILSKLFEDFKNKFNQKLLNLKSQISILKHQNSVYCTNAIEREIEIRDLIAEKSRLIEINSEKDYSYRELFQNLNLFKESTQLEISQNKETIQTKDLTIETINSNLSLLQEKYKSLNSNYEKLETQNSFIKTRNEELEDQCDKYQKIANELAEQLECNMELRNSLDSTNALFNEKSKENFKIANELEFLKRERNELLAQIEMMEAQKEEIESNYPQIHASHLITEILEQEHDPQADSVNFDEYLESRANELNCISDKEKELVFAICHLIKESENQKKLANFYENAFKDAFEEKESLIAENKSLLHSLRVSNQESDRNGNGLFRNLLNSKHGHDISTSDRTSEDDVARQKMLEWKDKCIFFAKELERVNITNNQRGRHLNALEYENSVLLKENEYLKSSIKENQRHLANVSSKICEAKGQILNPIVNQKPKSKGLLAQYDDVNIRQKSVKQYNKFKQAIDRSESKIRGSNESFHAKRMNNAQRNLNIETDLL